jgi:hypothetical protein
VGDGSACLAIEYLEGGMITSLLQSDALLLPDQIKNLAKQILTSI